MPVAGSPVLASAAVAHLVGSKTKEEVVEVVVRVVVVMVAAAEEEKEAKEEETSSRGTVSPASSSLQ